MGEVSQARQAESAAEQRAGTWQRRWESHQSERRVAETELKEAGSRHSSLLARVNELEQFVEHEEERQAQSQLLALEQHCRDLEVSWEAAFEERLVEMLQAEYCDMEHACS